MLKSSYFAAAAHTDKSALHFSSISVGSDTDLYFIDFAFYQLYIFINYRLAKCNCYIAVVLKSTFSHWYSVPVNTKLLD